MPTSTRAVLGHKLRSVIGCNIRAGMTPGGFSDRLPTTSVERNRKCMEVHRAAMAFLENRVVRTPAHARTMPSAIANQTMP